MYRAECSRKTFLSCFRTDKHVASTIIKKKNNSRFQLMVNLFSQPGRWVKMRMKEGIFHLVKEAEQQLSPQILD